MTDEGYLEEIIRTIENFQISVILLLGHTLQYFLEAWYGWALCVLRGTEVLRARMSSNDGQKLF